MIYNIFHWNGNDKLHYGAGYVRIKAIPFDICVAYLNLWSDKWVWGNLKIHLIFRYWDGSDSCSHSSWEIKTCLSVLYIVNSMVADEEGPGFQYSRGLTVERNRNFIYLRATTSLTQTGGFLCMARNKIFFVDINLYNCTRPLNIVFPSNISNIIVTDNFTRFD